MKGFKGETFKMFVHPCWPGFDVGDDHPERLTCRYSTRHAYNLPSTVNEAFDEPQTITLRYQCSRVVRNRTIDKPPALRQHEIRAGYILRRAAVTVSANNSPDFVMSSPLP